MRRFSILGALAAAAALLAVTADCGSQKTTDAAGDAGFGSCTAYVGAYEACLDRLGPAARAAGDRALAAAKEQFRAGDDGASQARCEAAARRLAATCR